MNIMCVCEYTYWAMMKNIISCYGLQSKKLENHDSRGMYFLLQNCCTKSSF